MTSITMWKFTIGILLLVGTAFSLMGWWVYRYHEACGSVEQCAAVRVALREANERLAEGRYCQERLAGLRRSHERVVDNNIAQYEGLIECGCPPDRWVAIPESEQD